MILVMLRVEAQGLDAGRLVRTVTFFLHFLGSSFLSLDLANRLAIRVAFRLWTSVRKRREMLLCVGGKNAHIQK